MRLSRAQREVLKNLMDGKPLVEYMTPDHSQLFFRTLGDKVRAKLNFMQDGKRVGYRTFWVLFKHNLITQNRYKGTPSPQDALTGYKITQRGWEIL